ITRAPVVVVMGHVDHGKTSLLDAIRQTNVASGEAGGITQHIGAYRVNLNGRDITFLDTPGHAAFTSMRARGAQVTDIAILVVAADDGIMPQTVEAINHAKAANVPIVVAVNKIDKENANPDKIMQQLTEYDLVPEEWGGTTTVCRVSAKKKEGIDNLLEMVLLTADVMELRANPKRLAKGTVIEAKLDRGRGPVATVLVQNGTLKCGDIVIAGMAVGRVRAMTDDKGNKLETAGPSVPVEIIGFAEVPGAGDLFYAVEDERMARTLAEKRRFEEKEEQAKAMQKVTLENLFEHIETGEVKTLNVIVKADVKGSCEAVKSSLEKISNDEVKVQVIHAGVGGINSSDVMLASASNAIIVGFNVRPEAGVADSAAQSQVDIRTYSVIYDCIEEIEQAIHGMLAPKFKETVIGHAEVRQIFKASGVGTIGGCYVTDGKMQRNEKVRVVRDNIVIFEGDLATLRRFKDDVKEVAEGFECGLRIDKYNDIKEGDIIEAFVMEQVNG
ncbi:MAG: translation initiation factor IF-2, partial [Clostridia bacterium]|nr:translation initiation factor IF-2 [Clostridia bacterium]